jgi:putative nucleotidyltransferase with HDIG domain
MPINIQTVTSIFASVTYGSLLVLVLFSRPLTRLRMTFLGYLSAMVIWSISALIIVAEFGNPMVWLKVLVASAILMMLSIFFFVQTLFANRYPWTVFIFWYGIAAIIIALFSNLMVRSAFVRDGFLIYEYHPFIAVIAGPGYLLCIFSLLDLVRGLRATDSDVHRNRLRYLIIALALIIFGTVINWTPYGKYPVDIAVNGIAAILIAFAIFRFSLLDIRIVFRTGLLYSIITGVTGVLYYLVISITLQFLESYTGLQVFTLAIVVALITSLVLSPLRSRIQGWVDQLFYRQKYDTSLMLQRLSEATTSLMDLDRLSIIILDEIVSTMHLEQAHFFVRYERDDVYRLISTDELPKDFTKAYSGNHPVIEWLSRGRKTLAKQELLIEPYFKSLWSSEVNAFENQGIEVFVPIFDEDELVGFFAIGAKKSGQRFTAVDQRVLVTLANQTALAVKNARLYDELQETFFQTIVTLANAIDIRDTYTSDHSQRIAKLAIETAREMGCNQESQQEIYWGSLLHDIGKIGIPDSILLKEGPLDEEEWEIVRRHPTIGANIIQPIKQLAHISPIIQYSHEWYNGEGYPAGIAGKDIPLGARIVGVVDAFSAMIDRRVYKEAKTLKETVDELKRNSGSQFDPDVVAAFLRVLEMNKAVLEYVTESSAVSFFE